MRVSVLTALLGILQMVNLSAQPDVGEFSNYNINNGLSQSSVLSIYQDKKGFMWFGTSDGLNRFDGKKFTVFKNKYSQKNSLSDSWVVGILTEDSENNLWIITSDNTFNKFNLKTFAVTRFSPSQTDSNTFPPFRRITLFLEDSLKNIWLATESGVYKFSHRDNKVKSYCKKFNIINKDEKVRLWGIKDNAGNLWFGSKTGLCRYNYATDDLIHYFNNGNGKNGLPQGTVIAPVESDTKQFWLLTDRGLCLYNPLQDQFILYPFPAEFDLKFQLKVTSLISDKNDIIWIGTLNGLISFNKQTGKYSWYRPVPGNNKSLPNKVITRIYQAPDGGVWIGTENGLCKFEPNTQSFDVYKHANSNEEGNYIHGIFRLKNDELWVFSNAGMDHGGTISKVNFEGKYLERIEADRCDKNSIVTSYVFMPVLDKTGNLWMGTFGDGVIKYSPRKGNFKHYQNLSGTKAVYSSVWGFTEDSKGNIWIALFDNGFSKFDTLKKTFQNFRPEVIYKGKKLNYTVTAISADKNDKLWIATVGAGLMSYDPHNNKIQNFLVGDQYYSLSSNFIRSMYLDHNGKLYLCHAQSGIDVVNTQTREVEQLQHNPNNPNSLPGNSVWAILPDKKGNFWVSMEGYISYYDVQSGKYTNYEIGINGKYGFPADKALCMIESSKGDIWFGTAGGGLSTFDKQTKRFVNYSEDEGLINGVIYGISEDDAGNLWLSTNRGLSRFNPSNKTFTNFDVSAGLQSNEFNSGAYYKSRNNLMYFGGINGFNVFDPLQIKPDTISAPTVFTEFLISNKPVPITRLQLSNDKKGKVSNKLIQDSTGYSLPQSITYLNSIEIPYKVKTFTIEFAALLFNSPEKCTYRYIMEGFEDEWNYSGTLNQATYTNLPHGTYTFKVQSANPDGVWGKNTAEIKVTIIPPFWKTWWFISLIVFSIIITIRVYIKNREMYLRKTKALLEEKVKQRTTLIEEKNEELRLRNIEISRQKEEIAYQAKQLKSELVHQNQTSEIALLRSQINPHFLFNTLNNIYSLVYKKSDDAPVAVMKLSEIMRYMLYDAVSDKVQLEKEINYLNSFIELQVLRIKNRECVDFSVTGNIFGKMVAPMLFIPFVENAFKHANKKSENPCIIINLAINEQHLTFDIVNQFQPGDTANKDQTGGIGLVNVQRRLELLYPNKHKLVIDKTDGKFHVSLELTINEN